MSAVIIISLLALAFGLLLGFSRSRFHVDEDPVTEKVNELLPQSQCGKCGYPGCRPYAEAISRGDAPINLCPPGGEGTMINISELLGVDQLPLNEVAVEDNRPKVAVIDETICIGCTVCIKACPVDAILGATRQMHTVIAEECTGCDKCIEPCPVDCIVMVPVVADANTWLWPFPEEGVAGEVIDNSGKRLSEDV